MSISKGAESYTAWSWALVNRKQGRSVRRSRVFDHPVSNLHITTISSLSSWDDISDPRRGLRCIARENQALQESDRGILNSPRRARLLFWLRDAGTFYD